MIGCRYDEDFARRRVDRNRRRHEVQRAPIAFAVSFRPSRNRQVMMFGESSYLPDADFEGWELGARFAVQIEGIDGARIPGARTVVVTLRSDQQAIVPCIEAQPFAVTERELQLKLTHGWVMFQLGKLEQNAVASQDVDLRIHESQPFVIAVRREADFVSNAIGLPIVDKDGALLILNARDRVLRKYGNIRYLVQDFRQNDRGCGMIDIVVQYRIGHREIVCSFASVIVLDFGQLLTYGLPPVDVLFGALSLWCTRGVRGPKIAASDGQNCERCDNSRCEKRSCKRAELPRLRGWSCIGVNFVQNDPALPTVGALPVAISSKLLWASTRSVMTPRVWRSLVHFATPLVIQRCSWRTSSRWDVCAHALRVCKPGALAHDTHGLSRIQRGGHNSEN